MATQDYSTSFQVVQSKDEVFAAINNVRGWWTENFEGSTGKLHDVFTVRFGAVYVTAEVATLEPGKKAVWHVVDCNKPWLKNKKEWNGTDITFEITGSDGATEVRFTHAGLVPEIECFDVCANAWGQYIQQSLRQLVSTGKGKPDAKAVQ